MEKRDLHIGTYVPDRKEFIPGFGNIELTACSISIGIAIIICIIMYLSGINIIYAGGIAACIILTAIVLLRKDRYGENLIFKIRYVIAYHKSQKRYLYEYHNTHEGSSKKVKDINSRLETANEFTNVSDIKGNYLYSKDNYIFGYLRVHPFNIDLLSKEELKAKTQILTAGIAGDRKTWGYFSMQREIDLDGQKKDLEQRFRSELASVETRHLLKIMIQELTELSTSGENYEHQHYIKLWEPYTSSNRPEKEAELKTRLLDFKNRYDGVGIRTELLDQQDILKMCALFASAAQAPFIQLGKNSYYDPMVKLK